MAFGILDDPRTPMPIGTVVLDDVFGAAQNIDPGDPQFSHLKRDGHIVLQPQPSDSPNDPLNWPVRQKYFLASNRFADSRRTISYHIPKGRGTAITTICCDSCNRPLLLFSTYSSIWKTHTVCRCHPYHLGLYACWVVCQFTGLLPCT